MRRSKSSDKRKRKSCNFCADKVDNIEFKDVLRLKRYLTERGKILPRRITGNCAYHQRMLSSAIKRAREAAVIGYIFEG